MSTLFEDVADVLARTALDGGLSPDDYFDITHHSLLNAVRRKLGNACSNYRDEVEDNDEDDIGGHTISILNGSLPAIIQYIEASCRHAGHPISSPKNRKEAIALLTEIMHSDPFNEADEIRFPVYNFYSYNLQVVLSLCSFGFLAASSDSDVMDGDFTDEIPF